MMRKYCLLLLSLAMVVAQQQKRRSANLHKAAHESTVRNILLPKFKPDGKQLVPGNHTSNVAVLVSSSRYWFNYRHVTNALSMYHLLKRGGYSDDNIILMLADEIPCNSRNPFRGSIFSRGALGGEGDDLMADVEVDYAGTDVTVDAFLRVLLGRHLSGEGDTPGLYRRTLPRLDENTNVLVYLTGHGGDNFFKFQDGEELMSHEVASVFSQMYEMRRYNEVLFIADTCQAFTMADQITAPNVFSVGSSLKGQNSYASHGDAEVGQSVIDRYSKSIKDFVDDAVAMAPSQSNTATSFDDSTVAVMERLNAFDALVRVPTMHGELGKSSEVGYTSRLCKRRMSEVPLSDFFAASSEDRNNLISRSSVQATIWKADDFKVQADSNTDERECKIMPDNWPEEDEEYVREEKPLRKGVSAWDTEMLVLIGGFIMLVSLSSKFL
mmetsp:Transcript_23087/g.54470  ORF Transcript_23087/g.54470 Transcript_23087/m.54470 type:complete len:439 (+) Transcript_23087:381-1697(+)